MGNVAQVPHGVGYAKAGLLADILKAIERTRDGRNGELRPLGDIADCYFGHVAPWAGQMTQESRAADNNCAKAM